MSEQIRDTQLDIYRALSMMYVICITHIAYWLGMYSEPLRSILLIEMPIIFFISGAALSIKKENRSLISTILNRAKRILYPYYAYILVCIVLLISILLIGGDNSPLSTPQIQAYSFSLKNTLGITIPHDSPLPLPYMYHIWFIIPYMIVTCSFGYQKRLTIQTNKWIYITSLALICIIIDITNIHKYIPDFVVQAIFYNFFFMAGYLFYHNISKQTLWILSALSGICIALFILSGTSFCPMQSHKFPPDTFFLIYGIFALTTLSAIIGNIKLPNNRILRHWNTNGYNIYLYQNITYTVYVVLMVYLFPILQEKSILNIIIATFSIFVLSSISGKIFTPIEKSIIGGATHAVKKAKAYISTAITGLTAKNT